MPYCPQCRAEYAEGIAVCHDCGKALVPERPEARPPTIPYSVHTCLAGPARALGYAREAARLLVRRPGLLALPLLVLLFCAAEGALGNYLTGIATTIGRQDRAASHAPVLPPQDTGSWLRRTPAAAARAALEDFRQPVTGPRLAGVYVLLTMATQPGYIDDADSGLSRYWPLAELPASLLLVIVPSAIFLAGYYGVVSRVVGGEPDGREAFMSRLKENGWQFVAYLALVYLIHWGLGRVAPGLWPSRWVTPVVLLLTGLGLMAITREGVGAVRALGRSASTILRDLPVCLTLLALLFVMLVPLKFCGLAAMDRASAAGFYSPEGVVRIAVFTLATGGIYTLIGVWLVLAQFLWYREASAGT
jgi:hypothetical protein